MRSVIGAAIFAAIIGGIAWAAWSAGGVVGVVLLAIFVAGVAAMARAGFHKERGDDRAAKRWELVGILAIMLSGLAAIYMFLFHVGFHGPVVIRP